jgi:hypothetical protein
MLILFSCGNKEKITLQYNFKQGEILGQNMVMSMDLVQQFMSQEMKISLTMGMKTTFEVKESQDNSYTLEGKYKELKVDAGMPGMEAANISFDSNTDKDVATETDLGPMFKAIIDKPFEVVMNKNGKVKSVKGISALLETMLSTFDESIPEDTRQQLAGQFGAQFSEEAFASQFEQSSGLLPDKPVEPGDSWDTQITTTASNFKLSIKMTSTLKSIEDNIVTLNVEGTVSAPEDNEQEINGVKTKISLKGTQQGTIKLNKDTGWTVSSDMMLNFNGEIEAGGMKVPIYVASKITVTDK